MKRTGTHFHIVRLQNRAALITPIIVEFQDDLLEAERLLGQLYIRQFDSFLRECNMFRACFGESTRTGQPVIGVFALLRRFQFSDCRNRDRRRVENRVAGQRIKALWIGEIIDRNARF